MADQPGEDMASFARIVELFASFSPRVVVAIAIARDIGTVPASKCPTASSSVRWSGLIGCLDSVETISCGAGF